MANYKIENGTLAARRCGNTARDGELAARRDNAEAATKGQALAQVRLLESLTKLEHDLVFADLDAADAYLVSGSVRVLTGMRRVQSKVAVLLGDVRSLAAAVEKGEA